MEMHCVKCRKKVDVSDAKPAITKNNKHCMKGTCPHCKTNLIVFVKKP